MLVLCNGAYKSGSTWLFNIVAQLTAFEFPPPNYRNRKWRNPSIDPARLVDFIRSVDLRTRNFVSKQHIGDEPQRDLVLASPNVLILDIERDLRDVIVSAYYHHRRDGRFVGSIADFYRTEGRLIAHQVSRYHELWRGGGDKVLVVSYEALHTDFAAEVGRIAAFLGVPSPPALIERIRQETTIDRLRAKYGEARRPLDQQFFRKGIVGGWRDHLNAAVVAELRAIETDGLSWSRQLQCRVLTKMHRALRAYPRRFLERATGRLNLGP